MDNEMRSFAAHDFFDGREIGKVGLVESWGFVGKLFDAVESIDATVNEVINYGDFVVLI